MSDTNRDKRATLDGILDILLDALDERAQTRLQAEKPDVEPIPVPDMAAAKVDMPPDLAPQIEEVEMVAESAAVVEEIPVPVEPVAKDDVPLESETALQVEEVDPATRVEEILSPEPVAPLPKKAGILSKLKRKSATDTIIVEDNAVIVDEEDGWGSDLAESERELPLLNPDESINMSRTIARLFVALVVVIVFANIPINYSQLNEWVGVDGTADTRIRFVSDGTLLRNDNKVYVMEQNKIRWITTSEAFDAFEYRWRDVRVVSQDFLDEFEEGTPIYLPIKCTDRVDIYLLSFEGGRRIKRWIPDIDTFESLGLTWDDVEFMSCSRLAGFASGSPIPELAVEP